MKSFNIARLDWDKLKWFYLMAQFPSLSHAAAKLNITQSALSRTLADLERMMGMKLFERRVRGISLLREGQELLEVVSKFFQDFTQYEAHRLAQHGKIQGSLRISISPILPVSWLIRDTSRFLQQHPDIQFSLIQPHDSKEAFTQQADCSIQEYDASLGEDMVQKPLVTLSYSLYASKSYLEQHGPLKQAEDINLHPKVFLKTDSNTAWGWPKEISCDPTISKIHEFSTAQDVLWATQQGLGIAALPRQQVCNDPDLVALPFYLEETKVQLCYTYPKYYQQFKRVTLYEEFLTQNLKEETLRDDLLSRSSPVPRGIDRRAA